MSKSDFLRLLQHNIGKCMPGKQGDSANEDNNFRALRGVLLENCQVSGGQPLLCLVAQFLKWFTNTMPSSGY